MKIQTDVKAGAGSHIIEIGQAFSKETPMKIQTEVKAGERAVIIDTGIAGAGEIPVL